MCVGQIRRGRTGEGTLSLPLLSLSPTVWVPIRDLCIRRSGPLQDRRGFGKPFNVLQSVGPMALLPHLRMPPVRRAPREAGGRVVHAGYPRRRVHARTPEGEREAHLCRFEIAYRSNTGRFAPVRQLCATRSQRHFSEGSRSMSATSPALSTGFRKSELQPIRLSIESGARYLFTASGPLGKGLEAWARLQAAS